ncbi:MAG TPA: M56 family metallopeptidase, partial [Planctomycetota bacterium]
AAARAEIAWPTLLASAYLLGVLLFLLRHLAGKARLRRLLAACREAAPASVPGFTLPHGTRLLLSPQRVRPFCTGVLRPVIVLPDELLEPDRAAEARAVAAHEASHLRAGDSRVSALLALLAIPLYCHPLFWWLCREVRFCNELLADDDAAGPDRNSYARALLDLAEHDQPALAAAGTVAVFHRPSEFYRRIQMLLQRRGSLSSPPSLRSRAMHALAALCFVGTVASLFGAPAAAQDPPDAARRQRESELLDTIAALRAEIRELRTLVQTHNAEPVAPARTPTPPLEATRLFGEMQRADAYRALLDQQPGDSSEAARRRLMSKAEHYVVKNGDSLERIAKRELGDASRMDEIRRLNPEIDPERLRVGQTLLLPGDALLLKLLGRTKDSTVDSDLLQDMARSTAKETGDRFGQGPGAAPAGEPPPPSGSLQPGDLFTYPARPGQNVPRPAAADTAPSPANATEELTSRYLDLLAGIEVAEAVADDSKKLSEAGLRPQLEARKDAVNLRTLKKKFAIVERLLDGEIAATEAEIAWLTQKIEASEAGERAPLTIQCDRARTRLEALRSVK